MASKKNKKQDANKKPKQQVKVVKKSPGKNPNSQKNSDTTAVSTSPKPRVYKSLPNGYRATKNAKVVDGKIEIHNGKPLFTTNKNGQKQIATDRNGNPAHKKALLVVDPQAHTNAKKQERRDKYLRKDEVRLYQNKNHLSQKGKAHPARIIAQHKNAYKFNVVTHSETFFNEPTIELSENPNKNKGQSIDERKSRASVPRWENKRSFGKKKQENWRFSKADKKAIKKNNKKYENRGNPKNKKKKS